MASFGLSPNEMGDVFDNLFEAAQLTNRQFTSREKSLYLNLAQTEIINTRFTPDANTKGKGFESDSKRLLDLSSLVTANVVYLKANGDFVRGTPYNGALRNNDKTEQGISNNETSYGTLSEAEDMKYGVLAELENEVLFIVSENCDISQGSGSAKVWRYNVKIEDITHSNYMNLIYNSLKNPFADLVWRREFGSMIRNITRNTNNFRSTNALRVASDTTILNPSINGIWKYDGSNKRIVQLMPGVDWDIEKYNIIYVRRPANIVVDYNNPSNQIYCELHPHIHYEVVQVAVRKAISAIIPAEQKYQVAQNENVHNE